MAIPVVPEASMVGKTGPGKLHSQGVPLIKGKKKKSLLLKMEYGFGNPLQTCASEHSPQTNCWFVC